MKETISINQNSSKASLKVVRSIFKVRELTILIIVLFIGIIISFFTPYFLTTSNLMGIAKSFSTTAIIAIGMTMVIITGGIDLSVGSVLGLSALLTAIAFENNCPPIVCILVGLSVGIVFGIVNGLLITKMKLQPFIATLGTVSIGRGMIYIVTKGTPRTPELPEQYVFFGQGYLGFVPMPVVILTFLTIIFAIVMAKTKFGRHVYAIGGNELASKLSGVKTDKVKIFVYTLSGILASIAGIVLFARLTSAEASAGTGIEMDVIAGTVIGGASMAGGAGSVVGAIIGSALIGVITNGVVLLNINTYAQQAITGFVILIAVSLDMLRNKKS